MRYFFNVQDGCYVVDNEGVEFATWEEVRLQAVAMAGEAIKDGAEQFWPRGTWSLVVTDSEQRDLLRLDLVGSTFPAAAINGAQPNHINIAHGHGLHGAAC